MHMFDPSSKVWSRTLVTQAETDDDDDDDDNNNNKNNVII